MFSSLVVCYEEEVVVYQLVENQVVATNSVAAERFAVNSSTQWQTAGRKMNNPNPE